MVAAAHTADTRHADLAKKQDGLTAQVAELSAMVSKALGTGGPGPPSHGASGGGAASSSYGGAAAAGRPAGGAASTAVNTLRAQAQEAMENSPREHTTLSPEALRVSGPPSGRGFVMRFATPAREGRLHIEEVLRELCDRNGWRAIAVKLEGGSTTKMYVGRDNPRGQIIVETTGRRIAKAIMARCPGADIYRRKWDHLALLNRQPVARLILAADGLPGVLWNQAALDQNKLGKGDLLHDMARAEPPSAASVDSTA